MTVLLMLACQGEAEPVEEPLPPPRPPEVGELLISQLYTTGALPAGGTDHYYSDQFIELVNATEVPLELSGLRVANVYGSAGRINVGMQPDSYRTSHPDLVVMETVWRIPDGAVLQPGEAVVIAHDGTNHRPFSDMDLSSAGFEAYVSGSSRDDDHPTVPNLEEVVYNGGYDWLITVFGPSVVVLDADTELGETDGWPSVSVDAVLDGLDTLMDGDSGSFKRLPDSVDAGFSYADGPYTGTAVHRLQEGGAWRDTNNSTYDFVVGPPEPTLPSGSDEVFGDPFIELGSGYPDFEPLADGQSVELVAGPQGGWHIDTAVWFGGFGPNGVTLTYDAVDTSAQRVSYITQGELYETNVLDADEGWYRVGDRVVMDIDSADEVVGQELILRVTAALGEQTWSDERSVSVVDEI